MSLSPSPLTTPPSNRNVPSLLIVPTEPRCSVYITQALAAKQEGEQLEELAGDSRVKEALVQYYRRRSQVLPNCVTWDPVPPVPLSDALVATVLPYVHTKQACTIPLASLMTPNGPVPPVYTDTLGMGFNAYGSEGPVSTPTDRVARARCQRGKRGEPPGMTQRSHNSAHLVKRAQVPYQAYGRPKR